MDVIKKVEVCLRILTAFCWTGNIQVWWGSRSPLTKCFQKRINGKIYSTKKLITKSVIKLQKSKTAYVAHTQIPIKEAKFSGQGKTRTMRLM